MTHRAGDDLPSSQEDLEESADARRHPTRNRDRQFRTLVDAVEEYAIFRLDPDGYVASWNSGAERIKGYDAEEILGEHFSTFYTEENRAAGVPEENLAAAAEQGSVEDEGWRVRKDGSQFWANVTITAIRNDDGDLEGYAKVTRDMTERRDYEEQLRNERDFTEQVLDTAPASIFVMDATGDVVMTNDRLADKLGVDEVAGGLAIGDLTMLDEDGDPIPPEERPYWTAFEAGEGVTEWQCQVELPSGDRRWVTLNATPIDDDGDGVERVVVAAQDVTQLREQAEQVERQRDDLEAELAEIFDRVDEGFFTLDQGWRITYVNKRTAELVRLPREELLGARVWDALHEVAEGYPREMAEAAMKTQEPVEFDFYSTLLGIWAEVRAYPSQSGMSVYVRDITERKERERALEESEQRYRTLVEHFPNGAVALVDGSLYYRTVGGTPLDVAGTTIAELKGRPVREVLPAELADELVPRYEAALRGETPSFEGTFDDRVYQFQIVPVRDEDGEVFAAMGMSQDVTERKEREWALEESEQRYRTLVEHFPNGAVALFDDDLRYTTAGGQLLGAEGVDPEDRIGVSIFDLYSEDIVKEVEPYFEAALEGEANSFEVEYLGRNLFTQTLPVSDADGKVYAGMLVVQDVTERQEYERHLEESNARLEQFAYAASHDLQEPLRMVSSYLQLIERRYGDRLDEDGKEFLEFAADGAERMRAMIESLLKYSRIETQGDLFEPIDLDSVLETVLEDLQLMIEESGAEITADPLPRVEGDADQLRQVFQNLLDNAIEYSGDEPPRIRVSADRDGDEWVLSIRDEGIGIDPKHAERIFGVFQRLHTRGEHPGIGIGLALCERIVEHHGGEIWVDSQPGEGTTFYFTLQASDGDADHVD